MKRQNKMQEMGLKNGNFSAIFVSTTTQCIYASFLQEEEVQMANRGNEGGQIDYCLDFLTRGTPLLLHGGPQNLLLLESCLHYYMNLTSLRFF